MGNFCYFLPSRIERWKLIVIFVLIVALFLLLLSSILTLSLPSIIESRIRNSQLLIDDSLLMQRWSKPKYPYSVKNPDDVISGNANPHVVKSGPFVFDTEHIRKIFSVNNGTVKYETLQVFHFNEAESCVGCFLHNRIWVPNLVFQKFIEASLIPSMKAPALAALLLQTPFLEVDVGEFMFDGYADPFLDQVCNIPFVNFVCDKILDLPERIGLFYKKNATSSGFFEAKSGEEDNGESLGKIISWNNMTFLPENWWDDKGALGIKGTDGTVYPPYIEKSDVLQVFVPDMCRTISLVFQKEVEFSGIKAYRFVVPFEEWDWKRNETKGFCHSKSPKRFYGSQPDSCLPTGLLDVSRCQRGEPPIVVSQPKFLYAPDYVLKSIDGMDSPRQEIDQIEIDLEPRLGAIIRANRRFQINIAMWKGLNLTIKPQDMTNARNSIIPVLEIDERENLQTIKSKLINMERTAELSFKSLLVISLVAITALTLFSLFKLRNGCNKDAMKEKVVYITSKGKSNPTLNGHSRNEALSNAHCNQSRV